MRIIIILFIIIILLSTIIFAQEMPLVYDVENTGVDAPTPYLPSFGELPIIQSLPDPFMWTDGRDRIANYSDWRVRRAEIGAEIQYYEIGQKPTRPDTITASFNYEDSTLTVIVTRNDKTLTLTSHVYIPDTTSPFPAVIGMVFIPGFGATGSLPGSIFTNRNIASIEFVHNQVTTYSSPSNSDPYYKLYPELNIDNTGQYSAWAWGVSRLIDGLELVQDDLPIDLTHLAVTGCSYAGKMALFAGAFDERVALTIAQESGGGGAPSWRYSHSEPAGTVEKIDNTDYNWFKNSMSQFSGDNVWRMPEDHHELMAMVAPRALLVTGNTNYTWLSNPSCYVSSRACQEVYNALGIADRFGFYIDGGHSHCAIPETQVPAIEAFVDKFLLGIDSVDTDIAVTPFNPDLTPWINWTTPTISTGTSFFGRTSLIYPSNLQDDLDTSFACTWNSIEDAEKYIWELSTNAIFTNIIKSDSTIDTIKTVTGLSKGKQYYWRVQVKNTAGSYGPWTIPWKFITFIPTPAMPELGSPHPVEGHEEWYMFNWTPVEYAEKYNFQISRLETFSPLAAPSVTTTDSSARVSGLLEAQKYYWRVQGENVRGTGLWTVSNFTSLLSAPTNLALKINSPTEIILSWTDNSSRESGYLIERKQSPESIFSLLDTLDGSGKQYIDNTVVSSQTYTYRIKAFRDSVLSEYSNEASILFVGIKDVKELPTEYSLSQNYPNPFNPSTKINYALPKSGQTRIFIYDILGREILTLINKKVEAGYHSINFNAHNLPGGIYFYRIKSGNFVQTKRMLLIK